jgi:sugar O-acyltransferase (sialic acid O-acetyltransferase NeuD family)
MKQLAIYGAGGFGKEIAMLIELINEHKPEWELIGFYDDGAQKGKIINGYTVLGGIEELNSVTHSLAVVIAIGDSFLRKRIRYSILNHGISYPSIIHHTAKLGNGKFIKMDEGCIICPGVFLTVNITVGKHVILSWNCTVGHDCIIEDFASVMPAVNISGEVHIGECVYVGTGVNIVHQIEIGEGTIVGAGAVVSKSLPPHCTAVGVPAKPIKFNK